MVSTVRKSQASMLAACARKKARHDECIRCGAGWFRASSSTLRTEVAETAIPRPLSSPTIRLYPQCGFSPARRRMSSRSERSSGGRPGLRCEYVQRRATSWRCQRSSVSGLNEKLVHAVWWSERLSVARSARPARGGERESPTSSSDVGVPAATPARTGSGQRDTRTTRAISPSLGHGKSAEPSEPDKTPPSRGRVCEPYPENDRAVGVLPADHAEGEERGQEERSSRNQLSGLGCRACVHGSPLRLLARRMRFGQPGRPARDGEGTRPHALRRRTATVSGGFPQSQWIRRSPGNFSIRAARRRGRPRTAALPSDRFSFPRP